MNPIKKSTVASLLAFALFASYCHAQHQTRVPPERLKRVPTVAALATAIPRDGDVVILEGYYASQDGGGQPLVYDRDSSATVDSTFTFNGPGGVGRYLATEKHVIIAERAGLVGDHTTDNRTRFQAIIDAIFAGTTPCRELKLTSGKSYRISGPVVIGRLSGGAWQQVANFTISGSASSYDDAGTG